MWTFCRERAAVSRLTGRIISLRTAEEAGRIHPRQQKAAARTRTAASRWPQARRQELPGRGKLQMRVVELPAQVETARIKMEKIQEQVGTVKARMAGMGVQEGAMEV